MSARRVVLLVAAVIGGLVVVSFLRGVFSGPLVDGDDDEAGRIDGVCTLTSRPGTDDERRQRCAVTLTIGDGETELQLAAVGRVEADDVVFSVVGGGGEYAGASGEAVFDFTDRDRTQIDVSLDD